MAPDKPWVHSQSGSRSMPVFRFASWMALMRAVNQADATRA
jgi:hypothetical protein